MTAAAVWVLLAGCATGEGKVVVDTGSPCAPTTWFVDADGDGYGGPETRESCEAEAGLVQREGDCDDADAARNPAAEESCNDADDNCDGSVDEGLSTLLAAPDVDGDGYGDTTALAEVCALPERWVTDASDCLDIDATVNPDGTERCDGLDNDCDGLTDDEDAEVEGQSVFFVDGDGDGFGGASATVAACTEGNGASARGDDCDDADASVSPGGMELCLDQIDQDCDGNSDDYTGVCWPLEVGPSGACGATEPAEGCEDGVAAVTADGRTWGSVRDAVTDVDAGEVITVCPGIWTGAVVIKTDLTLIGYGPGVSVLSGGGSSQIINVHDADVSLVNLSLDDGDEATAAAYEADGGSLCTDTVGIGFASGSATILSTSQSFLTFNFTLFYAGDVLSVMRRSIGPDDASPLAVNDCLFSFNESVGAMLDSSSAGPLAIERTAFDSNSAGSGVVLAAEAGVDDGLTVPLTDVHFSNNIVDLASALKVDGSDVDVSCTRCTFTDNTGFIGGAVEIDSEDSTVTFTDSTFEGNVGTYAGAIGFLSSASATLVLTNSTFTDNRSDGDGGAISLRDDEDTTVTITGGSFTENSADLGGAIALANDSVVTAVGVDFIDNSPDDVTDYSFGLDASFTCTGLDCE